MSLHNFLKLPFKEGIEEFKKKIPVLSSDIKDFLGLRSMVNAFTISRAIDAKALLSVKSKLLQFMMDGGSLVDFKKWFVSQRGISNPTMAYAENVFRTNLNTSYNAGRYSQAIGSRSVAGFQFIATGGSHGDGSTRKNHAAAHGLVAPKDHPIWNKYFPPLGYQCRCSVRLLTFAEAKRGGFKTMGGIVFPWHPTLGFNVTLSSLHNHGAFPDSKSFGKNPSSK